MTLIYPYYPTGGYISPKHLLKRQSLNPIKETIQETNQSHITTQISNQTILPFRNTLPPKHDSIKPTKQDRRNTYHPLGCNAVTHQNKLFTINTNIFDTRSLKRSMVISFQVQRLKISTFPNQYQKKFRTTS